MQRLFLKKNPRVGPAAPARYQIWHRAADGSEREIRFTGFSYYGEISGLRARPADSPFVELVPGRLYPLLRDWRPALGDDASGAVTMTYAQWMSLLADHRINHSRIFVFPEVAVKALPFARHATGPFARRYDLTRPNDDFFSRLQRYLGAAHRRGIVVQISLASIQSLRDRPGNPADWDEHPFNAKKNGQGFIATPEDPKHPDFEKGGVPHFCQIQKPSGAVDTVPEKLYEAQKRMVEWIVDAAKPYWNVMFELFNEPNPNLVGAQSWHVQVAQWLDAKLRDPATGQRSHLVSLNAPDSLLDPAASILRDLLLDGGRRREAPLVDIFQFHGEQWGGPSGKANPRPNPAPRDPRAITAAARAAVDGFYARPLNAAGTRVEGSRIAVICDGDAHYVAQDHPEVYARAAAGLGLSYIHRWSSAHLTQGKLKAQVQALCRAVPAEHAPRPGAPDTPTGPGGVGEEEDAGRGDFELIKGGR